VHYDPQFDELNHELFCLRLKTSKVAVEYAKQFYEGLGLKVEAPILKVAPKRPEAKNFKDPGDITVHFHHGGPRIIEIKWTTYEFSDVNPFPCDEIFIVSRDAHARTDKAYKTDCYAQICPCLRYWQMWMCDFDHLWECKIREDKSYNEKRWTWFYRQSDHKEDHRIVIDTKPFFLARGKNPKYKDAYAYKMAAKKKELLLAEKRREIRRKQGRRPRGGSGG
jgi:hypothetical protein